MTTVSWVIAVTLYGIILSFFFERTRTKFWALIPDFPVILPIVLAAAYVLFSRYNGGIDEDTSWWVLAYYLIPSVLLWLAKEDGDKVGIWDVLALICFWLPLVLHWWPTRPHATRHDKPLILISATIIGLFYWVGKRRLTGTKIRFGSALEDWRITLCTFGSLVAVMLPLAVLINFVSLAKLGQNLGHFNAIKFFTTPLLIFMYTALVEEFFFRGIIQNFLEKSYGKTNKALLLASLVFAVEHLSQNTRSWNPADWNFKYAMLAYVAGLGYGWVYRNSSSIVYAVLTHALIDACWGLFK